MAEEYKVDTAWLDVGGATDVGRVRPGNEDALLVLASPLAEDDAILIAVADGMGGHNAGEVASALAVEALREAVFRAPEAANAAADALLKRAVLWANQVIWEEAQTDAAKLGMGTTLVCALLRPDGSVFVANVGDSRGYVVGARGARQVTVDHSWVMERVLAGDMSQAEAERSPFRSVLTRSLGMGPRAEVDVFTEVHVERGEALLLCSDGVTTYLGERDFPAVMAEAVDAQDAAERIVRRAVERGGADNATAVVARRT